MSHRKLTGLFRFHRFKRKVSAVSAFLVLTLLVLFFHDFVSVIPDIQVKRRFNNLERHVVGWAQNTAQHVARDHFTHPPKSVRDLVNATVMKSDLSESLKRRIILVLTENNLTSNPEEWNRVNISSLHRNLPSLVNLTLSCVEGQDVSKCDTSRVTQLFMMNTQSLIQDKLVNATKRPKVVLNPGPVNPMTGESLVLPGAIIIGAKKCGTRALLEYLRIHPNVSAVGPELHFFDKKYQKGLQWYSDQMPKGQPGWLYIEKTPSYFVTKEAPARVYYMNPKVLLLLVVRDPVTRAISDYAQAKSKKPGLKSFEEFSFTSSKPSVVSTTWPPIRLGVYAKYLERWLNYFPMSQFHFVSGEGLIQDPAHEVEKVQDFLGLSRYITEKHFYFNATKGFPCLVPEKNLPPKCLGKTKGRHHPTINHTVYNRLREFYRPFNQKFYSMTGIDFSWP